MTSGVSLSRSLPFSAIAGETKTNNARQKTAKALLFTPPPGGGRSARASGTGGGDSVSARAVLRLPHPGPQGRSDPPPSGEGEAPDLAKLKSAFESAHRARFGF